MLDIISMATLLIIMLIVAIFMILIIIGSNIEKSEYERYLEDKEQQAYITDYMEQKKNKKKGFLGGILWNLKHILGNK